MKNSNDDSPATAHPTFAQAFMFWLKLGFISFGGPAGQISIMHQELVEQKRWISNERFLNALNYCMLLPGPEAQQLAVYIGWLLHRIPGGIAAGALFVIPSMFILFALSYTYAAFGTIPWVAAAFVGLKAAVMAIVVSAVIKIGKKVIKNNVMLCLAVFSFVAIYFLKIPFPVIILGAGLIGLLGSFVWPEKFQILKGKGEADLDAGYVEICPDPGECHISPSMGQNIRLILVFGLLWIFPVMLINAFLPGRVFYT